MAVTILDTFTGTNGDNLTAHTPDSGGVAWSKVTGVAGNFLIDNNRAYPSSVPATLIQNTGAAASDYDDSADLVVTTAINQNIFLVGSANPADQDNWLTGFTGGKQDPADDFRDGNSRHDQGALSIRPQSDGLGGCVR